MHRILASLVIGTILAFAPAAHAQFGSFLEKTIKDTAKRETSKAINQGADAAYDGTKGELKGDPPAAQRQAAPAQPGARGDSSPGAQRAGGAQGEATAAAVDQVAPGEVYGNRFDFVPGDKVLVFDDFAETEVGDYPARWTLKEGGGNPTEVVSYKGRKWWKSVPGRDGNDFSMHWLRYAPNGDFPQKFTIEFDADMGGMFSVVFSKQGAWGGQEINFRSDTIRSANVNTGIKPYGPVVQRVSISVNGTYAKVYVGGNRVLQDPDAIKRPITRLGFRFEQMHRSASRELIDHQMMTGFRFAEGGKDLGQAIDTEGRIVIHGIYFDTGSDVIRPESGGALRAVLAAIQNDPALRFRIEGHTDDQGGAAVNGPLSDRRAAAVKTWLVGQGVDEKRLDTKGFGATKPIDVNTSQEGRANNRRVELVKLAATS